MNTIKKFTKNHGITKSGLTKIISMLLVILTISCAFSLPACKPGGGDDTQTTISGEDPGVNPDTNPDGDPDGDPQAGPDEHKEWPKKDIKLISKTDNFAATLVRNDSWEAGSFAVDYARDVLKQIQHVSGINPRITTDWKKKTDKYDSESVEILFGHTDNPESQAVLDTISYGEYKIKAVGNKLVVVAFDDGTLYKATLVLKKYIEDNYKNGELVIPKDLELGSVVNARLNSVPRCDGGRFECTYNCGNKGVMIYAIKATREAYDAYLEKLEKNGWNKYTVNEIEGNVFGTFTNDKYTLTVGYYKYENAIRIIIEALAAPVPFESENKYKEVTTSKITMFGLEHKSSNAIYANGLSILIRLADGRFVIIDGGFTKEPCSTQLAAAIREQSKEYTSKPVIAAWIITHAHGDHTGALAKNRTKFAGFKIENFLFNFMSETERLKAVNSAKYKENWDAGEGSAWKDCVENAKFLRGKIRHVHVGQVFYFADLKMEVLYTIESYAPKICNALNTTSLIFKMTFKSGDTFMMTGDATGDAMEILARMYGKYLKCDILQVCHHGYSTWGNNAGTIRGYACISPAILLWPQGSSHYGEYKEKSWNKVLFPRDQGGENDSFKECLVAGLMGERVELDIPYTVGTAKTYRK